MIFLVTRSWLVRVFLFCLFVFVVGVFNMPFFLLKYQICPEQRLFYSLLFLHVHLNDWHSAGVPQIFIRSIRVLSHKMYFIKVSIHYKCIDFKICKSIFIYVLLTMINYAANDIYCCSLITVILLAQISKNNSIQSLKSL